MLTKKAVLFGNGKNFERFNWQFYYGELATQEEQDKIRITEMTEPESSVKNDSMLRSKDERALSKTDVIDLQWRLASFNEADCDDEMN